MNKPINLLLKFAAYGVSCGMLWSLIAPSASAAISFVPQQEGEINVGFGQSLASSYLETPGMRVTSLADSSTGTKSRLFVDRAGTNNNYGSNNQIRFLSRDIGTAESSNAFWLRPVAMLADGLRPRVENGQLEVGTFRFDFDNPLLDLVVSFFDTESAGTSFSAYDSAGSLISAGNVAARGNNNIQNHSFSNVKSIVLNLGQANTSNFNATGDGVNLQMSGTPTTPSEDVPEPLTMGGMALAAMGLGYARRRRTHTHA
jgi:hypothetical protein